MIYQHTFELQTAGRGYINITPEVAAIVSQKGADRGLCNVFLHHTSASLILCENADPIVLDDLQRFFSRLVPDGDSLFQHKTEGNDDMPAHVRTVLTQSSITIPITDTSLSLGVWQGLFLWEHRINGLLRTITVTVMS